LPIYLNGSKLTKTKLFVVLIISSLLISGCSFKRKSFEDDCVTVAETSASLPWNMFFGSLLDHRSGSEKIEDYQKLCSCYFDSIENNLSFFEKIKFYFFDPGLSDPLYPKIVRLAQNAIGQCSESLNNNKVSPSSKTFREEKDFSEQHDQTEDDYAQQYEEEQPIQKSQSSPHPEMTENEYRQLITNKINSRKQYPRIAQMRGWQGDVTVSFDVNKSGELISSEIASSSNYEALDKAALAMVKSSEPFPPIPGSIGKDTINTIFMINFKLE
jgi:TonB family protein